METARKIHELESKLVELKARYDVLEEMDQQILNVTSEEDIQEEIEGTDAENTAIQDAEDLCRYRINTLRRANSDIDPHPPAPSVPSLSTSRPKIALPRFNGDILQWQPFWQAFVAEIESDDSLADINKFNYLLGQLDPNVRGVGNSKLGCTRFRILRFCEILGILCDSGDSKKFYGF